MLKKIFGKQINQFNKMDDTFTALDPMVHQKIEQLYVLLKAKVEIYISKLLQELNNRKLQTLDYKMWDSLKAIRCGDYNIDVRYETTVPRAEVA